MTVYIPVEAKKRRFTIPVNIIPRSEDSTSYELTYGEILWDDGTAILWDDNTEILWSNSETSYPLEVQAKKRNFTIIARF